MIASAPLPSPALDDERLDETFAALANSTRRAILGRLAHGEATVNELAEPFAMTLPAISKHLKVLESAGLIERGRRAQFRPCTLDPEPLEAVASWTDQYRHIWEDRFDRLDRHLDHLRSGNGVPTVGHRDEQRSDEPPSDEPPSDQPLSHRRSTP
ncbi:MAG: metalloregulator ArsR/SmtB family transcription factor [Actinomycetota bacterium]